MFGTPTKAEFEAQVSLTRPQKNKRCVEGTLTRLYRAPESRLALPFIEIYFLVPSPPMNELLNDTNQSGMEHEQLRPELANYFDIAFLIATQEAGVHEEKVDNGPLPPTIRERSTRKLKS